MAYQPSQEQIGTLIDFGLGINYEQAATLLKVSRAISCWGIVLNS